MAKPWKELALKNKKRLSERTQHYIKTAFSTLIKYAKEQDLGVRGNPAQGTAGEKPVNSEAHTPYTTNELQQLIYVLSTVNKFNTPELFWIPLLLLFTGARSNEICMLRCCDIVQMEEIWVINFKNSPEYHQGTKNGKNRTIPLHQKLIELGFLEYISSQKSYGNDRVFSKLRLDRGKWNVGFGKSYNRTFKRKFLKN